LSLPDNGVRVNDAAMTIKPVLLLVILSTTAFAEPAAEHKTIAPDAVVWGDAPPVLAKGAKVAVLYGDPSKAGLYIVRFKLPASYKIMPHWHPADENVTVISGAFAIGMGDKLDAKTPAMGPGTFFSMPAKMHHFAFTTKETIVDVAGIGPMTLTYINPADDPSKPAK
jgi:hypothetical protein